MSLKYFHLVFLAFAFLMDGGFWMWMHFLPEEAAHAGVLHLKPFAGILCVLIGLYTAWYLARKMRTIIV